MDTTPKNETPDDLVPISGIRRGEYVYTPAYIRKKIALRLIPAYRIANRLFVSRRVLEELGRPVHVPARLGSGEGAGAR